jgi:hypothetical protein
MSNNVRCIHLVLHIGKRRALLMVINLRVPER